MKHIKTFEGLFDIFKSDPKQKEVLINLENEIQVIKNKYNEKMNDFRYQIGIFKSSKEFIKVLKINNSIIEIDFEWIRNPQTGIAINKFDKIIIKLKNEKFYIQIINDEYTTERITLSYKEELISFIKKYFDEYLALYAKAVKKTSSTKIKTAVQMNPCDYCGFNKNKDSKCINCGAV